MRVFWQAAVISKIVPKALQIVPPAGALPMGRERGGRPCRRDGERAGSSRVARPGRSGHRDAGKAAVASPLIQIAAKERQTPAAVERRLAVVADGIQETECQTNLDRAV